MESRLFNENVTVKINKPWCFFQCYSLFITTLYISDIWPLLFVHCMSSDTSRLKVYVYKKSGALARFSSRHAKYVQLIVLAYKHIRMQIATLFVYERRSIWNIIMECNFTSSSSFLKRKLGIKNSYLSSFERKCYIHIIILVM